MVGLGLVAVPFLVVPEAGFAHRVRLHHPGVMYPVPMSDDPPEMTTVPAVQVSQHGVTCGDSSVRWAYLTGVRLVAAALDPASDSGAGVLRDRLRRLPRFDGEADVCGPEDWSPVAESLEPPQDDV